MHAHLLYILCPLSAHLISIQCVLIKVSIAHLYDLCYSIRRGPNKWRDGFLPKDILDDWLKAKKLPSAQWDLESKPISVTIGGKTFDLDQFGKSWKLADKGQEVNMQWL